MNAYIYYQKEMNFHRPPYPELSNKNLDDTHTLLTTLDVDSALTHQEALEVIFGYMQAENWSPNGEARGLIESLGLSHTSMSVGDVVVFEFAQLYICESIGWRKV